MRVVVDLFYRDASNYKLSGSTSFGAPLRHADVLRLERCLAAQMGFVPSAVGVEPLAYDPGQRSDDDHPWHDVTGVRLEDGEPDDIRSFTDFVSDCEKADWIEAAMIWERDTPIKEASNDDEDDDWLGDAA